MPDRLAELVTACEVLGWHGQEDLVWRMPPCGTQGTAAPG